MDEQQLADRIQKMACDFREKVGPDEERAVLQLKEEVDKAIHGIVLALNGIDPKLPPDTRALLMHRACVAMAQETFRWVLDTNFLKPAVLQEKIKELKKDLDWATSFSFSGDGHNQMKQEEIREKYGFGKGGPSGSCQN